MAPERTTLRVAGTEIYLWRDGQGPPLLFLHGAGGAGRWLPFHAALASCHTVYAPAHPGHAGSPFADHIETVTDLAFLYYDLLDQLGLEKVHLVGASFGGWVAAELAVMAAHRLHRLVLLDPVGIRVEGWIYPFLFGMDLAEVVQVTFHNPMAAMLLAPGDMDDPETLIQLYRERTALARVSWNPYCYNPALPGRLHRITCPTLLLWGAQDRFAPLEPCAAAWLRRLPDARLEVIDPCGHVPHVEAGERAAAAVLRFLGEE